MDIVGFQVNEIAVDIFGSCTAGEKLGLVSALDLLKKYFPQADIYSAILGGYKNIVAVGKKPIGPYQARPFLAFYPKASSKLDEKPVRIELRSEDNKFKQKVSDELGIEWDVLKKRSFELATLSKDASELSDFLHLLSRSVSIQQRAEGKGYLPDDYEQLSKPLTSDSLNEDTILVSIKTRRGQPEFRKRLFAKYGSQCCISGSKVADVLEAAHIVPHCVGTDYSIDNGLLLRADLHTLYDLRLIEIGDDGVVSVTEQLYGSEYESYAGNTISGMTPELVKNLRQRRLSAVELGAESC